jgi:hypothetical protein
LRLGRIGERTDSRRPGCKCGARLQCTTSRNARSFFMVTSLDDTGIVTRSCRNLSLKKINRCTPTKRKLFGRSDLHTTPCKSRAELLPGGNTRFK